MQNDWGDAALHRGMIEDSWVLFRREATGGLSESDETHRTQIPANDVCTACSAAMKDGTWRCGSRSPSTYAMSLHILWRGQPWQQLSHHY